MYGNDLHSIGLWQNCIYSQLTVQAIVLLGGIPLPQPSQPMTESECRYDRARVDQYTVLIILLVIGDRARRVSRSCFVSRFITGEQCYVSGEIEILHRSCMGWRNGTVRYVSLLCRPRACMCGATGLVGTVARSGLRYVLCCTLLPFRGESMGQAPLG